MWFPTHIRQGKATRLALTLSLSLVGSLCLTGCSQFPSLRSQTSGQEFHAALDTEVPPPIFDESVPAVRVADAGSGLSLVAAPKPFQWKALATSAGKRDIDGISIGSGGYRTLILGSLAGDDPLAISLTEEFAKHVYENNVILGGIEATFIRSPNPDGESGFRMENGNGKYLNRLFPVDSENWKQHQSTEPEIQFLLSAFADSMPQRVIHVRTYNAETGLVAASSEASPVAKEVAEWLGFEFIELPGKSSVGTLERFLSTSESCQIVTFAIPQSSDKSQLWETYGDSLMNLLLDEDFEARKLARAGKAASSADRRDKKGAINRDQSRNSQNK